MARTRIIIGHPEKSGSTPPSVIYVGTSGSEAEAAMKADTTAHHFEIFEGPGRRKSNGSYITPEAKAEQEAAEAAAKAKAEQEAAEAAAKPKAEAKKKS